MTCARSLVLALCAVLAAAAMGAATATASPTQESTFQDDDLLVYNTPDGVRSTLDQLKGMGVDRVRVSVFWRVVAPDADQPTKPGNFDATDPAAYPKDAWDRYDTIVREAAARGILVNFNPTSPAPNWATGTPERADIDETYEPDAGEYGNFLRALGTRYSGSYQGLPRVDYWSLWNEPNQPGWLTPQWVPDPRDAKRWVEAAPRIYRALVDAGYAGLLATGHGQDTILVGETAPKGLNVRGTTRAVKAGRFIRRLYCLDDHLQFLTGSAAEVRGCPTADQAATFAAQHPALFAYTGYAHHPYELIFSPATRPLDRDFLTIANLGELSSLLRRIFLRYGKPIPGGSANVPLYLTEFGYQTNPPDPRGVSPRRQQAYLDQSEYLTWRRSNVRTLSQFLLVDDTDVQGFQSGLKDSGGTAKPALDTYRLPVFLPAKPSKGRLKVWGLARAAPNGERPTVTIELRRGAKGAWKAAKVVQGSALRGAFLTTIRIGRRTRSGAVRLRYNDIASREAGFKVPRRKKRSSRR